MGITALVHLVYANDASNRPMGIADAITSSIQTMSIPQLGRDTINSRGR